LIYNSTAGERGFPLLPVFWFY